MISRTPPDVSDLPIALGAIRVLIVATDTIGLHATGRRIPQRRAMIEHLEAVARYVRVSPQVGERDSLEVIVRAAVLPRSERMIAVEPEPHPGLAPFAHALTGLDGEDHGQRDRPVPARVIMSDDDAMRLDALDDLGRIKAVDDVEHFGLLGRAFDGRRFHELPREPGKVPESECRPQRDGEEQARRHGVAAAPVPEPFDRADRPCADRLTAQVAPQVVGQSRARWRSGVPATWPSP